MLQVTRDRSNSIKRRDRRPKDPRPIKPKGHAHVYPPPNMPVPWRDPDLHLTHGYVGQSEPKGMSIGSAVFALIISITYIHNTPRRL